MKPLLLFFLLLVVAPAQAEERSVSISIIRQERPIRQPVSPLDTIASDEGLAGARLAIADNMTTGRLTGTQFRLVEKSMGSGADPAALVADLAQQDIRFAVVLADAPALTLVTRAAGESGMLVLNAQAPDDDLRNENCRDNLLHTIPSRAMMADGLAQYLVLKRWKRWFLVTGRNAGDRLLADAFRNSAKKFGAEVTSEKTWLFQPGNARADTAHVSLQTEIPAFTQGADYDVLVVADEADEFGDFLDGRTSRPRPIAGTHGLVVAGWSTTNEQWGATQLQNCFMKLAGRRMTPVDYAAWVAVRAIGEATIRAATTEPEKIVAYMRGSDFLLSGFKGTGQSFRKWDGQMRQPILIAGPRLLVSASPQLGFLHRNSELDTLGQDLEESRCKS